MIYFNENDEYPAQWLKNLWPSARVDSRSIKDVVSEDLDAFTHVHLFAGIGGWEYALQLAGWPADRAVWTGSCPCQPFSCAGKRKGIADDRHLWPDFLRLIAQHRPPTIFGEQVASVDGRRWFAGIRTDLEALGYGVGASDLCAASVGAPHIRQRLFWVADAGSQRAGRGLQGPGEGAGAAAFGASDQFGGSSGDSWSAYDTISCLDGGRRRIEPGLQPLANGIFKRTSKCRAYGNAIVPQVAAIFIKAFLMRHQ